MRLPTQRWVWLSFGLRPRRAPWRGVAPEGTAQLVVAMPASQSLWVREKGEYDVAKVFIGVDPHKLSATIEVVDHRETVLMTGRFGTNTAGYAAMRKHVAAWRDRVWAVEGSNGAGRPLAQRLLADGEHVVDVPAKLAARARLFDTGHNRKTDAHDAHSVAVVAVRTTGLRVLSYDVELEALRMLVDRREELTRTRVQTVNRLQRLLSELTRVGPSGTSLPCRQRRSWPQCVRGTWPGRPVAGLRSNSSPSLSRSRRRSRPRPRNSRRWCWPGARR